MKGLSAADREHKDAQRAELRDEALQVERLIGFLRVMTGLALVFCVPILVLGLWFRSWRFVLVGFAVAGAIGVFLLSWRLARRGKTRTAAALMGCGQLAIICTAAILTPFGYAALVVATLLAVASVLPYLRGKSLRAMLLASLGAMLAVSAAGIGSPPPTEVPTAITFVIVIAAIAAAGSLTVYVLLQFSTRLLSNLSDLQHSDAQLREAVSARDDFLSVAAHELRTPLTTLELRVSDLARRMERTAGAAVDADQVASTLKVLQRQVDRLAGTVENLLDVSRLVAHRFVLQPEEADFKAVVEEAAVRVSEHAPRTSSGVVLHVERCVGHWDRLRLEQIVTNLVTNAVKYGQGKPVEISLEARDGFAVLKVKDSGIGISPEDQSRIFERFERAVSPRHFGGLGLGLWIVKQVVTAMGGTISVKSAPGQGSEFTVALPQNLAVTPKDHSQGETKSAQPLTREAAMASTGSATSPTS